MFNCPLHLPLNKGLIGTDKQDDDRNNRHLGIELVSSSMIRMRSDKKKAASITWRRHCLVLLTQNNQVKGLVKLTIFKLFQNQP